MKKTIPVAALAGRDKIIADLKAALRMVEKQTRHALGWEQVHADVEAVLARHKSIRGKSKAR